MPAVLEGPVGAFSSGILAGEKIKANRAELETRKIQNRLLQQELASYAQNQQLRDAMINAQIGAVQANTNLTNLKAQALQEAESFEKQILEARSREASAEADVAEGTKGPKIAAAELNAMSQQAEMLKRAVNEPGLTPAEAAAQADQLMMAMGVDPKVQERGKPIFSGMVYQQSQAMQQELMQQNQQLIQQLGGIQSVAMRDPKSAAALKQAFAGNSAMLSIIDSAAAEGERTRQQQIDPRENAQLEFGSRRIGQIEEDVYFRQQDLAKVNEKIAQLQTIGGDDAKFLEQIAPLRQQAQEMERGISQRQQELEELTSQVTQILGQRSQTQATSVDLKSELAQFQAQNPDLKGDSLRTAFRKYLVETYGPDWDKKVK